ncbi:hypothetical protein PV783_17205 [Chitinophaga sp. CC14]|uniref:hypothetical protein n=1 Tax=Chitinophaga sp. CC14 TaxID=3029199 RepID=UPI003B766D2C
MNTLVGFACTMESGIVGTNHHENEDNHSHDGGHLHGNKTDHQHFSLTQSAGNNNDKEKCCNDNVLKFERIDKTVQNIIKERLEGPATFLCLPLYRFLLTISTISPSFRQYPLAKWAPPPNQDIRVSIQSFQI